MSRAARHAAALIALLPWCSGCLRLSYNVSHFEAPVNQEVFAALQPGKDDLDSCLRQLGAPHQVFEYRRHGMALLWLHRRSTGFGLRASYSAVRFAPSASFSFDSDSADFEGAMLWFDQDLVLERCRQGKARELTLGLKQRPAFLDEEDPQDPGLRPPG